MIFLYIFNPVEAISGKQLSKTSLNSLEHLLMLVEFLPEISRVFKHPKHLLFMAPDDEGHFGPSLIIERKPVRGSR